MGKMQAVRVALFANDASGSAIDAEQLAGLLRSRGSTVELRDMRALDGASGERSSVGGAQAERLVVAGGDGTLAPVAELAAATSVPLAVIPTGTANDFARALGLPQSIEEAVALAADPAAPTRAVDLLRADGRPFLNAASGGLSARAAQHAKPLKRLFGPLAYALGALQAGLTSRALRMRATVDGQPLYAGRAWQVIVAGTGAFGGGSRVDEAVSDDQLVDVVVVAAGSRLALVRRAYAMRTGGLTDQRGVHHGRGRRIELVLPDGARLNVDGEICPAAHTFEIRGERVDVVVGRAA